MVALSLLEDMRLYLLNQQLFIFVYQPLKGHVYLVCTYHATRTRKCCAAQNGRGWMLPRHLAYWRCLVSLVVNTPLSEGRDG
jgi:hypothetical protein